MLGTGGFTRRVYQGRGWKFLLNPRLEPDLERDRRFKDAQQEVSQDTMSEAAARAPRSGDSGPHLADSGQVIYQDGHWVVTFGEGLPDMRAIAQEYGNARTVAQPYLRPTAETKGELK